MSVTVTDGGGRVTVTATSQTATVETVRVVEVDVPGPQGPPGPEGPPGPASGGSYVHDQAVPAATWTITHDLGMYPNATVIDSAGSEVLGQLSYPDANTIQIVFSAAFAGNAYVS